MMQENKIEGAMNIWYEDALSEKTNYRLVFVPYSKRIKPFRRTVTGDDELETFLLVTGFETDAARGWLNDVRTFTSVWIDNVFVSPELIDSQPPAAKQAGPSFRDRLFAFLHTLHL